MGVSWDSSYGAGPAQPCLSNKDINSELLRHQQPAAGALLEDRRLLNLGLPSPRTPLTTHPLAGGVSGFAGPRHLDFTRRFGKFPGLGISMSEQ